MTWLGWFHNAYLDIRCYTILLTYLARLYVRIIFTSDRTTPRFGLTMMLPPKKWLEKALGKTDQTNNKYTTSPLLFMISGTTKYVCTERNVMRFWLYLSDQSLLTKWRRRITDCSLAWSSWFIVPEKCTCTSIYTGTRI